MIEINLIPAHLKKKKVHTPISIPNVPKEAMVGLVGGLVILLFVFHMILTVMMVFKFTQKSNLENQFGEITDEWDKVKVVLNELRSLEAKINAIEKVTTKKRISWAGKLNDISGSIPKGVWLNKLSLDRDVLLIDGSAVSKEENEMTSPGIFTDQLKKAKNFMVGLKDIDVSSIQRRQVKSTGVADFLITVKLKGER